MVCVAGSYSSRIPVSSTTSRKHAHCRWQGLLRLRPLRRPRSISHLAGALTAADEAGYRPASHRREFRRPETASTARTRIRGTDFSLSFPTVIVAGDAPHGLACCGTPTGPSSGTWASPARSRPTFSSRRSRRGLARSRRRREAPHQDLRQRSCGKARDGPYVIQASAVEEAPTRRRSWQDAPGRQMRD